MSNRRPPISISAGSTSFRRGFTLVEVLIVVIILGILASVVIAHVNSRRDEAHNHAFVSNLKAFMEKFQLREAQAGMWPADRNPGEPVPEMAELIHEDHWTRATSLGGNWDWDHQQFGFTAGVSVFRPLRDDAAMAGVDSIIDDGDLNTGGFRKRLDGFIAILQP